MCNPLSTLYPEALLARGTHRGYEWEIIHNDFGQRCGYVRIPAGHPWHGKGYEEEDDYGEFAIVHGGITFAEPDVDCGRGGADDAWWLGFDCGHYYDAPDPALPGSERLLRDGGDAYFLAVGAVVRTDEYVQAECERLIDEAVAAAAGP